MIGRGEDSALHIDLWIMSCRVFKRSMEAAMLDTLVKHAQSAGLERIVGYFQRSAKNSIVEEHYRNRGFRLESAAENGASSIWSLSLSSYAPQNRHIQVQERGVHA